MRTQRIPRVQDVTLYHPAALHHQRHLLETPQRRSRVRPLCQQRHQLRKPHHFSVHHQRPDLVTQRHCSKFRHGQNVARQRWLLRLLLFHLRHEFLQILFWRHVELADVISVLCDEEETLAFRRWIDSLMMHHVNPGFVLQLLGHVFV